MDALLGSPISSSPHIIFAMPPRLNILHAPRTLTLRAKNSSQQWIGSSRNGVASQTRSYSDTKKDPRLSNIKERTETDHNLHVSEEAKVTARAKGEKGPDLTQGTPVEEVVKGDKEAQEKLPKVMRDALKKGDNPTGTRSFSTMAITRPPTTRSMSTSTRLLQPSMGVMPSALGGMEQAIIESGMTSMTDLAPKEPRARVRHLHNRHQNIVEQLVGLLIRDGKKAAAQRVRGHSTTYNFLLQPY